MIFSRRRSPTIFIVIPFIFVIAIWWNPFDYWRWSSSSSSSSSQQAHHGHSHSRFASSILGLDLRPAAEDDPLFLWRTLETVYPRKTIRALPKGRPKPFPRVQKSKFRESHDERKVRLYMQQEVKKSFARCWDSYRHKAWTADELGPVSGKKRDHFGGWGATLVDSLDTLWIMDLKYEFDDAVSAAAKINFVSTAADDINVFETNIRYLGGFIAAYDLSGEPILLKKAREVADLLYKSFDTPNHMPVTRWELHASVKGVRLEAHRNTLLAEIGSLTLEFIRLSQITGDMKYFDAVQRVMDVFKEQQDVGELPGMWPILIDAMQERFNHHNDFTLNAMADSMYEYLPKTHILTGGQLPMYEEMYRKAMDAALKYTVFRPMLPDEADILVSGMASTMRDAATQQVMAELDPEGQHLACYAGGMLTLGGKLYNNKRHLEAGTKLTEGCIWTYEAMASGIMPETFYMVPCESTATCRWNVTMWREHYLQRAGVADLSDLTIADAMAAERGIPKGFAAIPDPAYHLRPEAIESVFILYRITGRKDLLDTAWGMWRSIDTTTRTTLANAALEDVTSPQPPKSDTMESFWFGETLKYFYLIFSDPDLISLDEWVFNTEAHPFKRPVP